MTKKITKLMLNGQEYEIREYQSGGGGWQPDPTRTIFYYEFEQNLDDSSGNSHDISSGSSYTYDSVGGQYVLKDNGSINLNPTPSWIDTIGTGDYTVAFWLYPIVPTNTSNREPTVLAINNNQYSNGYAGPNIFFDYYNYDNTGNKIRWRDYRNDDQGINGAAGGVCASLVNGWHHLVMTRRSGTVYCYIDTVEVCNFSSSTNINNCNAGYLLGASSNRSPQGWGTPGAMMDKCIVEKVGWTAQEVSDYYNATKDNYPSSTPEPEPQTQPCTVCGGTGEEECSICGGTGQEMCAACSGTGLIGDPEDPETQTTCMDCDGTGFINCGNCGGTGMMICSNCGGTGEEPGE